jgi:hypothetical protein
MRDAIRRANSYGALARNSHSSSPSFGALPLPRRIFWMRRCHAAACSWLSDFPRVCVSRGREKASKPLHECRCIEKRVLRPRRNSSRGTDPGPSYVVAQEAIKALSSRARCDDSNYCNLDECVILVECVGIRRYLTDCLFERVGE